LTSPILDVFIRNVTTPSIFRPARLFHLFYTHFYVVDLNASNKNQGVLAVTFRTIDWDNTDSASISQ